jgi:hypothetical protein
MTTERSLDFRLAAWLDEEATSLVPEDLLDRSLARVANVRQRPGWLVRTAGSERDQPGLRRILVVAAAIVALAAAWIALVGSGLLPLTPSPTPTVSSSPSPTGPLLPLSLRSNWVGPTRDVSQIQPRITESVLILSAAELRYGGGGNPVLASAADWLNADRLTFRLLNDEAGCHGNDLGTYMFRFNETGRALTIGLVDDPCAARAAAIAGTWARADCPNRSSVCLGDLDAGAHISTTYNPFVPRNAYVYDYGRLSYVVPEGWTNQVDGPDGFALARQGSPEAAIFLNSTAIADSQAPGCPGTIEPGIGHTAAALGAWLTTLAGVDATTPAPVTVGGLDGVTLDVSIKPTWTQTCPFSGGKPYVAMFTNGDAVNNYDWGLAAGGAARLFLLDLPDGRTTLVEVEAPDRATWDTFVTEAMPIIGSFQFHPE